MAEKLRRRSQNVSGDFFVDSSCIDCDTCRWMAPDVFERLDGQSAVTTQPHTPELSLKALQALLACPTGSIGTMEPPQSIQQVQAMFPLPIGSGEPETLANGVFHCGYHSKKSFGAASYFIQRPQGNILVDSPRFTKHFAQKLESLGGIKTLYLTHRDDVADHQKFHEYFGCDRILHERDIVLDTASVEIQLTGHESYGLDEDVLIIPVPGHTQGHTVLLYRNEFLFTGDHLAWSDRINQLIGFRNHCWYSWEAQISSMKRLLNHSFEWVLPGHGRRYHAGSEQMRHDLQACIDWM